MVMWHTLHAKAFRPSYHSLWGGRLYPEAFVLIINQSKIDFEMITIFTITKQRTAKQAAELKG